MTTTTTTTPTSTKRIASLPPLLSLLLPPLLLSTTLPPVLAHPQPQPQPQVSALAQVSLEYTQDAHFRAAILSTTNTYRRQHNATGLQWNETLAGYARGWSGGCVFEHSHGSSGENLASNYPNATSSIIAWGHERVDYDFAEGGFSMETGHFTQLVWKLTASVGCGRTECGAGEDEGGGGSALGWYVVCEYYPAGNVLGSFRENVQEAVREDERPDGPSDPDVPEPGHDDDGKEGGEEGECPQGALCGGGGGRMGGARARGLLGLGLWVGGVVWALGSLS